MTEVEFFNSPAQAYKEKMYVVDYFTGENAIYGGSETCLSLMLNLGPGGIT